MARNPTELVKIIELELIRARQKHIHWPVDDIHRAMIILEQAGGVAKESYKCVYGGGNAEYLEKEVLHTLIVCQRFLLGG